MLDVVVVGAGPVGLTVAGDLAAAGFHVTVLERREGEHDPNVTRSFVVHARTLEMLESRGVTGPLFESRAGWVTGFQLYGGVRIDMTRLPTRYNGVLVTPQFHVDRALLDRARRLGADIIHDTTVVDVSQDVDRVTVKTDSGAAYQAKYLVGADGVHSVVRDAIGLDFPGVPFLRSMMLADVKLADPPSTDLLRGSGAGGGFGFLAPFSPDPDGLWRVIAWDEQADRMPDDAPVEVEHLASILRRAHGTDYGIHSPTWTSRFSAEERLVPSYRVGRVLLAGDAAHRHSPAGGQGLNLGVQDAANLSWRLIQVLRGAAEGLLDGYTTERRPVAQDVLRSSHMILKIALLKSRLGRAARRPVGSTLLSVPPIARKILGQLSGIGVRYAAPKGTHPLVGTRAPDLELPDGTRLYQVLEPGRFVLVSPAGQSDHRVRHIPSVIDGAAALVRPDGYIAWAGDDSPPESVLSEWLAPTG